MGKKFTTFVVLLAAVLFTLPTQAQIVKKAAPTGAMKTKVVSAEQLKAGKAAYEKANDIPWQCSCRRVFRTVNC